MSAIATLMATAAITVGTVAALRALKQRGRVINMRARAAEKRAHAPIDLEAEDSGGIWRVPGDAASPKGAGE